MTALAALMLVLAGVLTVIAHMLNRAGARDLEEARRILAMARALVGEWQAEETPSATEPGA